MKYHKLLVIFLRFDFILQLVLHGNYQSSITTRLLKLINIIYIKNTELFR